MADYFHNSLHQGEEAGSEAHLKPKLRVHQVIPVELASGSITPHLLAQKSAGMSVIECERLSRKTFIASRQIQFKNNQRRPSRAAKNIFQLRNYCEETHESEGRKMRARPENKLDEHRRNVFFAHDIKFDTQQRMHDIHTRERKRARSTKPEHTT